MTRTATLRPDARWITLAIIVLVLVGSTAWLVTREDGPTATALFPDPALAACVVDEAGGNAVTDSLSTADLREIRSLSCNGDLNPGGRIQSLQGWINCSTWLPWT